MSFGIGGSGEGNLDAGWGERITVNPADTRSAEQPTGPTTGDNGSYLHQEQSPEKKLDAPNGTDS